MTIKESLNNVSKNILASEQNKELRGAWNKLSQKEKDKIVCTIKKDRQQELIKNGWFK